MKDLRTLFIRWYFNQFILNDSLYSRMDTVVEDSPWHRESTVAVHTNMVVAEYLSRANQRFWSEQDLYGALACTFHDVGKPAARTEAYKPERGTYYRYGGHELVSARLWEDWAVRNWKFLENEFELKPLALSLIGWLIENHLPWAIKKPAKRTQLALGVKSTIGIQTFINVIKADSFGRISDNTIEKKQTVDVWCEEFVKFYEETIQQIEDLSVAENTLFLYMPIGVSGCGKSTFLNSAKMNSILSTDGVDELLYFSMDVLRHEWYDVDDYTNAFKLSCEDKEFKNKVNNVFVDMIKTGKSIYADNINISKKRRAQYIDLARKHGYKITAILIPVDLQTVLDRQSSRIDKSVPLDAVKQQYMQLSSPSLGEVDTIIVVSSNLPK